MRYFPTLLRGARACLLGSALLVTFPHAQAQAHGDAVVDPAAARQQAREIAQGDPARWYRELATSQARLRTLRKEIGAAWQEAKNACKLAAAAERTACLREARTIYERDMKQASAQLNGQANDQVKKQERQP